MPETPSRRPPSEMRRVTWVVAACSLLAAAALTLGGCDLLPQNATEWAIAGGIVVVLVGVSIYLAIKGARNSKR